VYSLPGRLLQLRHIARATRQHAIAFFPRPRWHHWNSVCAQFSRCYVCEKEHCASCAQQLCLAICCACEAPGDDHHPANQQDCESVAFRSYQSLSDTDRRAEYVVNGTAGAIPEVAFDIGESYAGLMPISSASNETGELYFWFFPSKNELAGDEITIWLNGVSSSIFIFEPALMLLYRDRDAPLSKVFCKRTDPFHGNTARHTLCTTLGIGLP
jgi:hypothetical protein